MEKASFNIFDCGWVRERPGYVYMHLRKNNDKLMITMIIISTTKTTNHPNNSNNKINNNRRDRRDSPD